MTDPPDTIRYLDGASVRAALPSQEELVDLAELALRSLVSGAQMPERAAVAPGPEGVFAGAMPARLRAGEVAGGGATSDLLGMKWIGGGTGNRARGLPALASLIVLDDPSTGAPVAIMDGDAITAARTAALSGVAVRLLVPRDGPSAGTGRSSSARGSRVAPTPRCWGRSCPA